MYLPSELIETEFQLDGTTIENGAYHVLKHFKMVESHTIGKFPLYEKGSHVKFCVHVEI